MTNIDTKKRAAAAKNILASWALEGFEPGQEFKDLLDLYVAGKVSLADIRSKTHTEFVEPGSLAS